MHLCVAWSYSYDKKQTWKTSKQPKSQTQMAKHERTRMGDIYN